MTSWLVSQVDAFNDYSWLVSQVDASNDYSWLMSQVDASNDYSWLMSQVDASSQSAQCVGNKQREQANNKTKGHHNMTPFDAPTSLPL